MSHPSAPPPPLPAPPKTTPPKVVEAARAAGFGSLLAARAHRKSLVAAGLMVVGAAVLIGLGYLVASLEWRILRYIVLTIACFGPVALLTMAVKTATVRMYTWLYEGGLIIKHGPGQLVIPWQQVTEVHALGPAGTELKPGEQIHALWIKTVDEKEWAFPAHAPDSDEFARHLLQRTGRLTR